MTKLPNGDRLMYVIGDFAGPGGARVEGAGVTPDEATPLSRSALLAGRDEALEAAVRWIQGLPIGGVRVTSLSTPVYFVRLHRLIQLCFFARCSRFPLSTESTMNVFVRRLGLAAVSLSALFASLGGGTRHCPPPRI